MKLAALGLLLVCGGCSLYFGDGDPNTRDPDPAPPPVEAPPPDYPKGHPPITPPCDHEPPVSLPAPPPAQCGGPRVEVFGIYEPNRAQRGPSHVTIDHPGTYRLVLSAYEETHWKVTLAPGATVEAVYLYGYDDQTVDLAGVPVETHTFATDGYSCGYSYPQNNEGCDTDALLARVAADAGELHAFHGCYRASEWTLHADDSVTSNCDLQAGYEQDDFTSNSCKPPSDWERFDFATLEKPSCFGDRFLRYDAHYGAWVGAILCDDAEHYKLYMNIKREGPFLQLADFAGHGQDHCELVNPGFTLPEEDNITSGGCAECSLGDLIDVNGPPVYARSIFDEPFKRVVSRQWADLTTNVYACGVAIE